jgi:hypothetical protein
MDVVSHIADQPKHESASPRLGRYVEIEHMATGNAVVHVVR